MLFLLVCVFCELVIVLADDFFVFVPIDKLFCVVFHADIVIKQVKVGCKDTVVEFTIWGDVSVDEGVG